jgi:hypothetical protein
MAMTSETPNHNMEELKRNALHRVFVFLIRRRRRRKKKKRRRKKEVEATMDRI